MTDAIIGYGVFFQTSSGAEPEQWTTAAETIDFSFPSMARDSIDISNGNAPNEFREFMPGMMDAGEISINLNFTAGQYLRFRDLFVDQELKHHRILFPDGSAFPFYAFITRLEGSVPLGDRIVITAAFKLSGRPELIGVESLGNLAAWFTNSRAYMTVNADGSGGSPADGGYVGRWLDRSGNNNHLSQTTPANRPIWRSGYGVNFRSDSDLNNSDLRNASTTAIPRRNSSGGIVVGLSGCQGSLVDFGTTSNGFAIAVSFTSQYGRPEPEVHTSAATEDFTPEIYISSRQSVITWRSNTTQLEVRVNGVAATHAALSDLGDMSDIFIGSFAGGNHVPIRVFELIVYDEDIGATNISLLEAHLRNEAGSIGDTTRTVVAYGDSLTVGIGSDTNSPWHDPARITNRSGSVWYVWARSGAILEASQEALVINGAKGTTEGIVVVWSGINDILINARTGAQVEGYISTFCTTLRTTGGNKVILCTLPAANGSGTARTDLNTLLKANYTSYADALVLLDEAPELDDYTDTTYYLADGVHLKDAGYAAVAALIQTAMDSIAEP